MKRGPDRVTAPDDGTVNWWEHKAPRVMSSLEHLPVSQLRMRLPEGVNLEEIPNLSYMLQLMACLEAINSALRWLGHTEKDTSPAAKLDKFLVWNVGAGWCSEAFRLLRQGKTENLIAFSVLDGQKQLLALWDRITAVKPDALISKIHRIRDKHFGHFDAEVMTKFIAWQSKIGATEPFFLGDETGHPLVCRFLWPTAASIFDIFPDPTDLNRSKKVDELLDDLQHIWAQTANLLKTLLEAWVVKCGFDFQVSEWEESSS